MGLDMYLNKHIYIGAYYKHRGMKIAINITENINGKDVPIKIDPSKISTIIERAGYWRKSNMIHAWFVTHVQNGKDDCQEYSVSYEQLMELKQLCEKVIETQNPDLLPTQAGFFFGSTEVGDWYYDDLRDTIKILSDLDHDAVYYYQSSW